MATLRLGQCVSAPGTFPSVAFNQRELRTERKLSDTVDFRPAVSASDQRLATGRKLATARVKTKPIPSSRSAWGSRTVASPDSDVHREFVSMARRNFGTPSSFVVKLTVTESSACICKKSLTRIDQRLESLGISALEAERRAGRRDAIRNMRRAVARGKGGVTMRTIDALAPALSSTPEWLLTGQDKIEADETTEIILLDKRSPLDDDRLIEAFGLAFQSLVGKLITEVEAYILARSVVRIIRLPEAAMTQAERRDMIRASVRLFRH